jgi:membrane associated rhomboid family serine protease
MFLLIPWRVDVPQDRWPVMNWLILLALVAVFALQIRDYVVYRDQEDASSRLDSSHSGTSAGPRRGQPGVSQGTPPARPPAEQGPKSMSEAPGITHDLRLDSWSLKRLLGYMWLHATPFHLLGNLLFLWIFGNALCAKLGNLKYLGLYILFGVLAGVAQLASSPHPSLGASGAINGVVGAYLVLFFENEITCLFVFWPIVFFYVRWFAVSSIWMILFWLLWDIVGALRGGSNVGHFAHLGGFTAGFGIALFLCWKGWITMEKYEKSLLQRWEERTRGREKKPLDAAYAKLGLHLTDEERQQEASAHATLPEPEAVLPPPVESSAAPIHVGAEGFIRTACACGNAIRVTRQYAGRTVRCPRCRQQIVIPNQTDFFGPAPPPPPTAPNVPKKAQDKCIRFVCTCGKRMKAPAKYAGRNTKCPRCGTRLKIPTIVP